MKIKTAGERCGECFIEGIGEDRTCKFHERDGQEACIGLKLYQEGQRSVIEAVLPVIEFYADYAHHVFPDGKEYGLTSIDIDGGKRATEAKEQLEKLLKELNQEEEG